MQQSMHGMWSSRLAFILAAAGSAVGLGNIWRFPYLASDHGGGAFVLVYLACIALCGLPILIAEVMIGRHGHRSPVLTFQEIAAQTGASRAWSGIGWMGMVAGVLILSFYSVVAGWTLHYTWLYLHELLGGPGIADPSATFGELLGNPLELTLWHAAFMLMTVAVVALGVEKGLERAVKFLMPALFGMLLLLVGWGATTGHLGDAAVFLFKPDFSRIDGAVFLTAMGQAFFSLSLGMCAMMTYGAYLPRDVSIPRAAIGVALTDTAVALLAGLAIFPIVIQYIGTPTGGGPGLIFTSLPNAFAQMGALSGLVFFFLLVVAAWTSSISLLEPTTAYLVERTRLSRRAAAVSVAALTWLLGLASVLSLNRWQEVRILGFGIMDFIELLANDLMLPLGGFLISVFVGWVLSGRIVREQFEGVPEAVFRAWLVLVRYVAPILVGIVLVRGVMARF